MTDLERMFRMLVATITSTAPDRLTRPFEVADLYQNILPYRLYRRDLGLETNQDYELALMQLLSGAGDYLMVGDRMRDVLTRELASPAPDSGVFRQFASEQVSINPDALARVAQGADLRAPDVIARPRGGGLELPESAHPTVAQAPAAQGGGAMSATAGSAEPGSPGSAPAGPPGRGPLVPAPGETCRFCGGRLPEGRAITYCPHCGHDQTVLHCNACGTELDVGWKYCTTCGRKVAAG